MARWYKHPLTLERERGPLPTVARSQKLNKLLERDPRFLDIPNFAAKLRDLSPVPSKIDTALSTKLNVNGKKLATRKALIAAALSGYEEKHFSDPSWRDKYKALRKMQLQSPEPARRGGQRNVPPSGADKRRYNPTGKAFASTVHGGIARMMGNPFASSWMQVFRNPGAVIPCVQRKSRREVMFAKNKAGRGYKVKHRRSWASGIPC